jgi:hypothetical protein
VNTQDSSTQSHDLQDSQKEIHFRKPHRPVRRHCFVEAERHISTAVSLIEEGRHDSATGAMRTCVLILDLLTSIQVPLRRLGNIRSEAAMSPIEPVAGAV